MNRPALIFVKNNLHGLLTGAEIGIMMGDNAKWILDNLNISMLYLIDPYEDYPGYNVGEISHCATLPRDNNKIDFNEMLNKAQQSLQNYKNIKWVRQKSSIAVRDIPDNLDFVYVDGNHNEQYVKEDIENYYPKLRNGGVLGGHDYSMITNTVTNFATKHKLEVSTKNCTDTPAIDWWIVKAI